MPVPKSSLISIILDLEPLANENIGFCLFLVLNVIGLAIYFAVLITVCTCIIVDEIRNKDYWRQLSEESITPEDDE